VKYVGASTIRDGGSRMVSAFIRVLYIFREFVYLIYRIGAAGLAGLYLNMVTFGKKN
jgi:hypothetical protein